MKLIELMKSIESAELLGLKWLIESNQGIITVELIRIIGLIKSDQANKRYTTYAFF